MAARRRGSIGERWRGEVGNYSSGQMGGCGQESLLCSKSLNLRRAEDVCSESGEDSRSIFSSDGWGEYPKNPGSGPPLLRSKRSRVVMGARSVGRERRSSLVLLDRGALADLSFRKFSFPGGRGGGGPPYFPD